MSRWRVSIFCCSIVKKLIMSSGDKYLQSVFLAMSKPIKYWEDDFERPTECLIAGSALRTSILSLNDHTGRHSFISYLPKIFDNLRPPVPNLLMHRATIGISWKVRCAISSPIIFSRPAIWPGTCSSIISMLSHGRPRRFFVSVSIANERLSSDA